MKWLLIISIFLSSCHYRVPITKKKYNEYLKENYKYKYIEKKESRKDKTRSSEGSQ